MKPQVFKDFADLGKVKNKFSNAQSLESVTAEMAGKEDFSNADGKENVDSLYNEYIKLLQELETLDINIQDKIEYVDELKSIFKTIQQIIIEDNPEYKRISDSLNEHIKAREGHIEGSYKWNKETPIINDLTEKLNKTPKTLEYKNKDYDIKKYQITTAESELLTLKSKRNPLNMKVTEYKNKYTVAKRKYDNDMAKKSEIDLAAYETQKQLEAEEEAKALGERKAYELEQEKSATLKAEKSAKMKKYYIYGGVAFVVVVGLFIAYKKGALKGIIK